MGPPWKWREGQSSGGEGLRQQMEMMEPPSPDLVGPSPEGPWRVSTQAASLSHRIADLPGLSTRNRNKFWLPGSTSFLAAAWPLALGVQSASPQMRFPLGRALLPAGKLAGPPGAGSVCCKVLLASLGPGIKSLLIVPPQGLTFSRISYSWECKPCQRSINVLHAFKTH